MPDEIQGSGAGPPRALVVAGSLAAVAALIGALVIKNHGGTHASPPPPASSSAPSSSGVLLVPRPSRAGRPAPTAARSAPYQVAIGYPAAPGLCGSDGNAPFVRLDDTPQSSPSRSARAPVRAYVGGSRPSLLSGGRITGLPIPGLTGATATMVTGVRRLAHGTVVATTRPCTGGSQTGPVYYLPDRGAPGGAATRLLAAKGALVALDSTGGATVVVGADANTAVRPVGSGGDLGAPVPVGGRTVIGAVPEGLLATPDDAGAVVVMLERHSGRVLRTLPISTPVAVGGHVVYGQRPDHIGTGEPLVGLDLATGARHSYRIPADGYVLSGVVSADGRQLAATVDAPSDNWRPGPGPGSLQVLDIGSGAWHQVTGIALPTVDPAALAWSGRTLVVSVASAQGSLVATWTTGQQALRQLGMLRGNSADGHAPPVVAVP